MPIYEFRCESCQEIFEHLAITAGEIVELKCPACGGSDLARVMSACSSVVSRFGQRAQRGRPPDGDPLLRRRGQLRHHHPARRRLVRISPPAGSR